MGAVAELLVIGESYDIRAAPTNDSGGSVLDSDGNIVSYKHLLRHIMFTEWAITKGKVLDPNNQDKLEEFCNLTGLSPDEVDEDNAQAISACVQGRDTDDAARELVFALASLYSPTGQQ